MRRYRSTVEVQKTVCFIVSKITYIVVFEQSFIIPQETYRRVAYLIANYSRSCDADHFKALTLTPRRVPTPSSLFALRASAFPLQSPILYPLPSPQTNL